MALSTPTDSANHVPVLLEEVVQHLVHTASGTYVDGTFGRGGHTEALLQRLAPDAVVLVLDRDPAAVAAAEQLAAKDARVHVVQARFSQMREVVAAQGLADIQGVLLDLGVSSPQLDDAQRGFSFRFSGPLDMRMNPDEGASAAEWLNAADEGEIARVIKNYAEERFARRIARAIVAARPLSTTDELAEVVAAAVPARAAGKHPATKTFQAIRIFINEEMQELEEGLQAAFDVLSDGGRLAVISFHSLEDRVVKQTFRSLTRPPALPRRVPVRHEELQTAAKDIAGPLRPGVHEVDHNPRARSATLRVIEKAAPHG